MDYKQRLYYKALKRSRDIRRKLKRKLGLSTMELDILVTAYMGEETPTKKFRQQPRPADREISCYKQRLFREKVDKCMTLASVCVTFSLVWLGGYVGILD